MKTLKKYKKHLQTRKKYAIIYKHEINRGVAQLVARVVWDHEVAGSIPVTSTIFYRNYSKKGNFFFCLKIATFSYISVFGTLYQCA